MKKQIGGSLEPLASAARDGPRACASRRAGLHRLLQLSLWIEATRPHTPSGDTRQTARPRPGATGRSAHVKRSHPPPPPPTRRGTRRPTPHGTTTHEAKHARASRGEMWPRSPAPSGKWRVGRSSIGHERRRTAPSVSVRHVTPKNPQETRATPPAITRDHKKRKAPHTPAPPARSVGVSHPHHTTKRRKATKPPPPSPNAPKPANTQ